MANSKFTDELTIREIEYIIRIKDKDKGFRELHDLLAAELTRFDDNRKKDDTLQNPIRDFLQTNVERSIVIRDNTKVFFLNYRENGSFTIQFTLVVITRYINYGTTRQALDYLIKDTIGEYFEELLERHLPVSVSVTATDKELFAFPGTQSEKESGKSRQYSNWVPVLIASLSLLFTIVLLILLIFPNIHPDGNYKENREYRDKYYELLIEKQVNQAIEREKHNSLIMKNPETVPDSLQNNNSVKNK